MSFSKYIIMNETEYRSFLVDLAEMWIDENDVSFWDFIEFEVDTLIDDERVEGILVFLDGDDIWVYDGRRFADLVKRAEGADYPAQILKDYGIDDDDDDDELEEEEPEESYKRRI